MAGRTLYIVSNFEEMIHEVPDSPQQLIINEIEKSTQLPKGDRSGASNNDDVRMIFWTPRVSEG